MNTLEVNTVEESELVSHTLDFWFRDNDHIRSPIPEYIRFELKQLAVKRFYDWLSTLKDDVRGQINDQILGEKFEEIIFETALKLVMTDDERITINYPFMPRLGDEIDDDSEGQENGRSRVTDRMMVKEGDRLFLRLKLERTAIGGAWETMFELPA